MKKLLLLIMVCCAIIIGCSDNSESQDDMNYTIETDSEMVEKYMEPLMNYNIKDYYPDYNSNTFPEKGKLKTKILKIRQAGTMAILPPVDCENTLAFVNVEGEGNISHMGLSTVNISYCSNDGLTSPHTIYGYLTAANGDKIFSKLIFASEAPDENGIWIQVWEVEDGSGRLDEATGEITLYITFDFPNSTWSNYGYGTITY